MKPEPGAPAFDNIDDLLADKIVNHGRDHADRSTVDDPAPTGESTTIPPSEEATHARPTASAILVAALIAGTVLFLLYRLFNRESNR